MLNKKTIRLFEISKNFKIIFGNIPNNITKNVKGKNKINSLKFISLASYLISELYVPKATFL